MEERWKVKFLDPARGYVDGIPLRDQAIIAVHIEHMRQGDFKSVRTKQLRGPVRELIVGHHRLTYFQLNSTLYFIRGFRKKSTKTPKLEIDYAAKVYKIMRDMT